MPGPKNYEQLLRRYLDNHNLRGSYTLVQDDFYTNTEVDGFVYCMVTLRLKGAMRRDRPYVLKLGKCNTSLSNARKLAIDNAFEELYRCAELFLQNRKTISCDVPVELQRAAAKRKTNKINAPLNHFVQGCAI